MATTSRDPVTSTPVPAEEPEAQLAADLAHLRSLVEGSLVDEARLFVRELVSRWPDDKRVQYWDTVLAPPVVRVVSPGSGRSFRRENAWIRAHAHEYPGCWLALYEDRLIAADPDRAAVIEAVHQAVGPGLAVLWFQPGVPDQR